MTQQFSTSLTGDGWVPQLSGDSGVCVVDMDAADYTMTDAEAVNGTIIIFNSGDGTKTLTYPAIVSQVSKVKFINLGASVVVDSGESRKTVCFQRADIAHYPGVGFFSLDNETVCVTDATEVITAADTSEQIIKQLLLPKCSFEKDGDTLSLRFAMSKSGTATTETLRVRIGALGTTADNTAWTVAALATTNDGIYGEISITRYSSTVLRVVSAPDWHVPYGASGTTVTDFTVADMDANILYVTMTGTNSSGAETATCKFWQARIER